MVPQGLWGIGFLLLALSLQMITEILCSKLAWITLGAGRLLKQEPVTDRKGALQAIRCGKRGLSQVKSVLGDSGYVGKPFALCVQEILGAQVTVQIAKRSELHKFAVIPKRWVVERSFAWLEKNRRLWKNCERKVNTSLQFIHLAFLTLLLRRS